jgi:hypothetical protein
MSKEIELGCSVKDKITGSKGVVTGIVYYLSGCNQVLVCHKAGKGGDYKANWFDVQRVERTKDKVIKLENGNTPGFGEQAPIR